MGQAFSKSIVEEATVAWLETLGWTIPHGADVAPGELASGQVIGRKA